VTQPRIPPRSPDDWDDAVRDALSVLRPPGDAAPTAEQQQAAKDRPPSNILGIFSWHPALTKAFLPFNNHLFHSNLSGRVREIVTVRTGWVRRGEYEWAQHVRMAQAVGVTEAEIAAISVGPDDPTWSGLDKVVLQATDELLLERYISDATWTELETYYDRQQIMDLVFTVGNYDLLAMAFNTFGLQLDPDLASFPADAAEPTA
jgi:4-carboxymuconolactone decarboxylase